MNSYESMIFVQVLAQITLDVLKKQLNTQIDWSKVVNKMFYRFSILKLSLLGSWKVFSTAMFHKQVIVIILWFKFWGCKQPLRVPPFHV
jgi:hypothetical protein